jgi:hypothetical protein
MNRHAELTFRENTHHGRHGWLRLTPAYSVKLVEQVIAKMDQVQYVLDPFGGTGTTGLVCATQGIDSHRSDINPFLVWFSKVKTANYSSAQLHEAIKAASEIIQAAQMLDDEMPLWTPPIFQIERWWLPGRLNVLARIFYQIGSMNLQEPVLNLLKIAFCQTLIRWSNAAFNHQSVSFKIPTEQLTLFGETVEEIYQSFMVFLKQIVSTAYLPLDTTVEIALEDARQLAGCNGKNFDAVITSPPYPNRMSYIRELRPYMYWLGYLNQASEAGELDWEAIGGTWGSATSRLQSWQPTKTLDLADLPAIVGEIERDSPVLANYVHRYFCDMDVHFENLRRYLTPNAQLNYIVGNSKFYDTLLPVEILFAELMEKHGFSSVEVKPIRKRNSKKELYEYIVSARLT